MVSVNPKYKDSLFCYLFGRPDTKQNLLELVNAVTGRNYQNVDDLEVNTIEDFLYINVKNDVSCIIGNYLYLFEAQASINPNMPVRELIYTAQIYQGILRNKNKYGRKLLMLPTPMCYVLCNDPRMQEERVVYRLSDAFANKDVNSGCEWTSVVYNINYGQNRSIMQACEALEQYSYLVHKVREYEKITGDLRQAVDMAINDCIANGILAELLLKQKTEVANMLYTEYDAVKELAMEREDGYQDGLEVGRKEGRAEEHIKCIRENIKSLMASMGIAFEKACQLLNVSAEDSQMIKKMM